MALPEPDPSAVQLSATEPIDITAIMNAIQSRFTEGEPAVSA